MDERITNLKNNFIEIIQVKESNIATLQVLLQRIQKIKECYTDFISSNQDTLSVFTLDSFHFQGRLIDIEYEDMNRLFLSISNRMYCDYYKLFKIMIEYIEENINDKKLLELIQINKTQYPVYKDLEPFKQYDLQYIQNLHELLLVILHYLNGFVIKKEYDLHQYQSKNKIGFNIGSFVNSFNYNNIVMKEKMNLFLTFIEFFHSSHTKYLKRFTTKLQLMLSQVNNDIKLENPAEQKDNKKMAMQDLKEANIDKAILQDLKKAMGDDSSVSSTSDKERGESDPPVPTPVQRTPVLTLVPTPLPPSIPSPTNDLYNNFLIEPLNIRTNISELTDDIEIQRPAVFSMRTPHPTPENSSYGSLRELSSQTQEDSQNESSRKDSLEDPHQGSQTESQNDGSQTESHEESQNEGSQTESNEESQNEGSLTEDFIEPEPEQEP